MITNIEKQQELEKEVLLLMSYKDKDEKLKNIVKEYRIKQLLELTAYLLDRGLRAKKYSEYDLEFMIKELLSARVRCLHNDYNWFWTDEDKQRLSMVNGEIFTACEKGFKEAFATAELLERRIKKRDSFLKDYEMEIKITSYPNICGASREATDTVSGFLGEESLPEAVMRISHCFFRKFTSDENEYKHLFIKKSTSWNTKHYSKNFPDINICYLVHRMMESSVWSYHDILSIRRIWVDVKVTYQYYRNIPRKSVG